MKISVIIGTYNGSKFLERQIQSIFNQTVLPHEIILLDDKSTDNTIEVLKKMESICPKSIKYNIVSRDKNLGYINNFIDGIINYSKGDITFLCDQDDIWDNKKIEKISNFFTDSNIQVIHSNTSIIDIDDQLIKKNIQNYKEQLYSISLETMIKKVNYPGMALAFRTEYIKRKLEKIIRTDIVLPTHDWLICCLAASQNNLYLTNEILSYRRNTGENVALRLGDKRISTTDKRIEGIELYLNYYILVKKLKEKNIININFDIKKYELCANSRIEYLKNKKITEWILEIKNIRYYPSKKAYLGDGILLFKSLKKNSEKKKVKGEN